MKIHSKSNLFKSLLIGILIQLTILPFAFGQSKSDKIDELMRLYTQYGQFNGSVLVAESGKVIFKKGFGLANMEWDIPNQPDTKHRLGSITKQFTSMLILQLVEQGKLKLDGKLSEYLPDYPKETADKITIHHLLTHSSGIPEYLAIPNFRKEMIRDAYTPTEFTALFSDSLLIFNPGEEFSYSNSGYFLLGTIIEKVTGKSYEQVLQENIFSPLKMNNTGFDHHSTVLKNRASGYDKNGNGYSNARYLDMSIPYAAGSLYSTTEDLYLWDQALYTEQLLPSKSKELLFKPHVATPNWGGSYGYGWHISKKAFGQKDSLTVISHGGGINGFNTLISRIPTQKHLIVLLNNTGSTELNDMGITIGNILNDAPYELPKKSLIKLVSQTAMTQGFDAALKQFRELKDSDEYFFKEGELNRLGYQMLGMKKVKEAIEIFKINVEAFPESGNVYDSLAEAYLIDGDEKLALKFYKKAVKINPKNLAGKKIIEDLQSKK